MTTETSGRRPQYGPFTPTRRVGLFGVPQLALLGLAAASLPGFGFLFTGHWPIALAWATAAVAATLPLVKRNRHGRNQYQTWGVRLAYARDRRAGHDTYLAGPAGHTPDGRCRLPGLLAASELTEHEDAYGQPFALLRVPKTNHYSVVLAADPVAVDMLDARVVDNQVANWGGWLGDLGQQPNIEGASVSVETAPESGQRLRRMLASQLAPTASTFAAATVGQIADTFKATADRVSTRVTITWSATVPVDHDDTESLRPAWTRRHRSKPQPRSRQEMVTEIANLLPSLIAGARATGAGPGTHALTAQDVVDETRVAFDPRVADAVEEARSQGGTGLTWADAGPVAYTAGWDSLRHDYGWSRSWYMTSPALSSIDAETLGRLLAPHKDVARKRVTLLYRPLSPLDAAAVVERGIRDTTRKDGRGETDARRSRKALLAERSGQEEAKGAGLLRFGVVVTATVTDPAHLPVASQTISTLAAAPRLQLRPALGNQAAAFVTGLPLGLVVPKHLSLKTEQRDALL